MTTSSKELPPFSLSASLYDKICAARQRDYDKEVADLAAIVDRHGCGIENTPAWARRVVDWGCGTGEHLSRWPKHGWQAMGIDPSSQMVKAAKDKGLDVGTGSLECGYYDKTATHCSRVQTCLFAAFSYGAVNDIDKCLKTVSWWAMPGGLFIFDVVNYSAAACYLRHQDFLKGEGFLRAMLKFFDLKTALLHNEITYETDRGVCFTETHILRAFTPREITDALDRHSFDVLELFDPESPEKKPPVADSFYFMVVARKR